MCVKNGYTVSAIHLLRWANGSTGLWPVDRMSGCKCGRRTCAKHTGWKILEFSKLSQGLSPILPHTILQGEFFWERNAFKFVLWFFRLKCYQKMPFLVDCKTYRLDKNTDCFYKQSFLWVYSKQGGQNSRLFSRYPVPSYCFGSQSALALFQRHCRTSRRSSRSYGFWSCIRTQ